MANRTAVSEIKLSFNSTLTNTLDNGATSNAAIVAALITGRIESGVGEGQANRAWASENRELGSGANETLDLYEMTGLDIGAGDGNDGLGQACLFEEIVAIVIVHNSGSGRLQIEPGTTNPLTALGSLTVANDGALNADGVRAAIELGAAGIDLSSSKKNVKFSAVGGEVTYSVYVLGRHDDDESSSSSSSSLSSTSSVSSTSSSSSSTSSLSSTSSSLSSSSSS